MNKLLELCAIEILYIYIYMYVYIYIYIYIYIHICIYIFPLFPISLFQITRRFKIR